MYYPKLRPSLLPVAMPAVKQRSRTPGTLHSVTGLHIMISLLDSEQGEKLPTSMGVESQDPYVSRCNSTERRRDAISISRNCSISAEPHTWHWVAFLLKMVLHPGQNMKVRNCVASLMYVDSARVPAAICISLSRPARVFWVRDPTALIRLLTRLPQTL